jgi:hypothetical protein
MARMTDDPCDRRDDEERDPVLAPLLERYNVPPAAPPLNAIWARMEADVAATVAAISRDELAPRRGMRMRTAASWAAALAASFVIGMGVGRMSEARTGTAAGAPVAVQPAPPRTAPHGVEAGAVFHTAAARHFDASVRHLAAVEVELRRGQVPADVDRWAAGLLLETRILLQGPAGQDPRLAPLLRDLEAALAELSALTPAAAGADAALTGRTLDRSRVVDRLRQAAGERAT